MGSGSRGRKKPNLRDYSRVPLTHDEKNALFDAVAGLDRHQIATAILGGVMVEHELEILLRRRFKRNDDDTWKELLEDNGPLRTFYSKITTAYAFGIFDKRLEDDLHIIRVIRNAFAHSKKLLKFNDVLIIAELMSANLLNKKHKRGLQKKPTERGVQSTYIYLCFSISLKLIQRRSRAIAASNKSHQRRMQKKFEKSPLARAFLHSAGSSVTNFRTLGSILNPPPFPAGQSGDPKNEAPPGLLGEWIQSQAKKNDKEGK
jgi:DNA-binding MltR family transcriptional regulator